PRLKPGDSHAKPHATLRPRTSYSIYKTQVDWRGMGQCQRILHAQLGHALFRERRQRGLGSIVAPDHSQRSLAQVGEWRHSHGLAYAAHIPRARTKLHAQGVARLGAFRLPGKAYGRTGKAWPGEFRRIRHSSGGGPGSAG